MTNASANSIATFSNQCKIDFLTLPYYAYRREKEALALCYTILHQASLMNLIHNEYLSGQRGFLSNFYLNLFYLPDSQKGDALFGKFQRIPAIICGAGPSLQKRISTY